MNTKLSNAWKSFQDALPPNTLILETRLPSVAVAVVGMTAVALVAHYQPQAYRYFQLSHPWPVVIMAWLAGGLSVVTNAAIRSGRTKLAHLVQLFDFPVFSTTPVIAAVLSKGPGGSVFLLCYLVFGLHYARTYGRSGILTFLICVVPGAASIFALPDVIDLILVAAGAATYTVLSKTEELRRQQVRREAAARNAVHTVSEAVAAAYDAARGRLAGEVGMTVHEQRNALTPALGEVFILQNYGSLDEKGSKSAQRIEDCILKARDYAETLLNSLRSQDEDKDRGFRLKMAIDHLAKTRATTIARGNRELEVGAPPDVRVLGKAHLIGDAISTIISNAFEAGASKVDVKFRLEGDGFLAAIRVHDNGPGVSDQILPELFSPYATYGKEGGIGLGLYVAKMVIESAGGTVELESTSDRGAVFLVRLAVVGSAIT